MTLMEFKEQSKCFGNLALLNSDKRLLYRVHVCFVMYKTAVYTLVYGVITYQKQQISKKVILCSMTLP